MSGTITFPLPSTGIARFTLDSILNVHTNGSGILQFNVVGTSSEFDFTAADEAAAVRIANLITAMQVSGASVDFVVGSNVNYPLPTPPATSGVFLFYDYLNNNWYLNMRGTTMDSAAYIKFNGVMRSLASISPTELVSQTMEAPLAYGVQTLDYFDARDNLLASTTVDYYYTLNTFLPRPFIGGTDNFTVNGSNFNNGTLGTVWVEDFTGGIFDDNSGHCPATFVDTFTLSCPAANWNPGDGITTPPLYMYYRDSGGKISNVLYVASIT